jgi:hypothetical protein
MAPPGGYLELSNDTDFHKTLQLGSSTNQPALNTPAFLTQASGAEVSGR